MAILTVQHLEKHFGKTKVLNDISFSLEQGQALSIIGSSGSGKTTLLRCLNFLETPDAGTITVQNEVLFDAAKRAAQSEAEAPLRHGVSVLQPLPSVHGPGKCDPGPGVDG